jgi:hypothetical protein
MEKFEKMMTDMYAKQNGNTRNAFAPMMIQEILRNVKNDDEFYNTLISMHHRERGFRNDPESLMLLFTILSAQKQQQQRSKSTGVDESMLSPPPPKTHRD